MPEIKNRTIRYGAVLALDDVTFAVQPGERVAVVGPNGAGKTTLLRALIGPGTAVVPQSVPTDLALRCRDFVMLGRTAHLSAWHAPSRADEESVDRALAAVDAADLAARRMDAISGGERQRLAIALALATEAPVLLLDEPTSHLDFRRRDELIELLARLDRTVVMTTHELPFDTAFFTRVVLIAHGRIVADGPPAEVLTSARITSAWGVPVTLREVRTASVAFATGRLGNLEMGR